MVDVQTQRRYRVDWRFISLWMVNEKTTGEWYTPEYRAGHYRGHQLLRIADQIRLTDDDPDAAHYRKKAEDAEAALAKATQKASQTAPSPETRVAPARAKLSSLVKGWSARSNRERRARQRERRRVSVAGRVIGSCGTLVHVPTHL